MKHRKERLVICIFALLGVVWAVTTDHFPMDFFSLDFLIDISSLLTVASFSVKGMLPLRSLAVASQIIAIPYFLLQPEPLWTPVGWTCLFLAINLYHITRILLERRPAKLSSDEQRLFELTFSTFAPRDFLKLVKLGEWKIAEQGEKFLVQGERIAQIAVPVVGHATANTENDKTLRMEPGELIGAGISLTNQPSAFDAEFAENTRYMCWQVTDINKFMDNNPQLALQFNSIVNRYLVAQINKLAFHLQAGNENGTATA